MSNPAALLHTQLKYWRVEKGEVVRDARLSSAESDEEVMIETQRAMLHIQNLEEILTSMEAANRRTGPYRQALPRWRKWIMCYPSSWYHPQADGRFASERDLDILENLADALDQTLPVFAENDRVGMRETLEDIRAAIANDASLPEPLRRHLHGLLAHTSMCLEEYDAFGDFELQKAIDRLMVSVNAAAFVSSDKSRWQSIKDKLMYPVLVGLAIQAPESVAQITAILP